MRSGRFPVALFDRAIVRLDAAGCPVVDGEPWGADAPPGCLSVVLLDPYMGVYFHFFEMLVMLFTWHREHCPDVPIEAVIVGHQGCDEAGMQRDLLAALYPEVRMLTEPPAERRAVALLDRATVISPINKYLDGVGVAARRHFPALRATVLRHLGIAPRDRDGGRRAALLYQPGTPGLTAPLERALLRLLANDFDVRIASAGLPWAAQVGLAAAHDVILASFGRSLSSLVWLPPWGCVIEVFPPAVHHYDHQLLAEIAAVDYFGLQGEHLHRPFGRHGPPYGHDEAARAPIAVIEARSLAMVRELLGCRPAEMPEPEPEAVPDDAARLADGSLTLTDFARGCEATLRASGAEAAWRRVCAAVPWAAIADEDLPVWSHVRSQLLGSGSFAAATMIVGRQLGLFERRAPDFAVHEMRHTVIVLRFAPGRVTILHPPRIGETAIYGERWLVLLPSLFAALAGAADGEEIAVDTDDEGNGRVLAFSSNDARTGLIPDTDFLRSRAYSEFRRELGQAPPWVERREIAFWRGASTGRRDRPDGTLDSWRTLPRIRLVERALAAGPALFDVGLSLLPQLGEDERVEIEAAGLVKPAVRLADFAQYRYQIDIDGNASAWASLFCKLLMGSVVLKVGSARGHRQWYYERLRPFEHYVPVAPDLGDLATMAQWCRENDAAARRIAEAGREFAEGITFESAVPAIRAAVDRLRRA